MCHGVRVNVEELVLSFYLVVSGVQPKLSALVAGSFLNQAILPVLTVSFTPVAFDGHLGHYHSSQFTVASKL